MGECRVGLGAMIQWGQVVLVAVNLASFSCLSLLTSKYSDLLLTWQLFETRRTRRSLYNLRILCIP